MVSQVHSCKVSNQETKMWWDTSWHQQQFGVDAGSVRAAEEQRRTVAGAGAQEKWGGHSQDAYRYLGLFMVIWPEVRRKFCKIESGELLVNSLILGTPSWLPPDQIEAIQCCGIRRWEIKEDASKKYPLFSHMLQQIRSPDKISFTLSIVCVGDRQWEKKEVFANEKTNIKAILYLRMHTLVHPLISRPQYDLRNACQVLALINHTWAEQLLSLPETPSAPRNLCFLMISSPCFWTTLETFFFSWITTQLEWYFYSHTFKGSFQSEVRPRWNISMTKADCLAVL